MGLMVEMGGVFTDSLFLIKICHLPASFFGFPACGIRQQESQTSQLVPGHLSAQHQKEKRCGNHRRQCRCRHYPKILARHFRALQQLGNPGKEQNEKADAAKNHTEVHGHVVIEEPQRQVDDDFDEEDFYGSDLSHNPVELGNS